jgi:four helix bundle protein
MSDFANELRNKTKTMAISIIQYCRTLPKSDESFIIKKQLIRSATSVAANYRAVSRSRSEAEFYSKLSIVVEETDETLFWLEILNEAEIEKSKENINLQNQVIEILKIVSKSRKTLKDKKESNSKNIKSLTH